MPDEDLILDLLLAWEEYKKRGETVQVESLCAQSPQLVETLRRRIQALESVESFLDDVEHAADFAPAPQVDRQPTSLAAAVSYRLLRKHASGGTGQIHLAVDDRLQRRVAVKLPHPHLAGDKATAHRLLREAQVTGRLEHPGVLPVYAIGNDRQGEPFYCMRFAEGPSLLEAIREFHAADVRKPNFQSLRLRELLQRFVQVCQTIAYAHDAGVLHGDLKPENIITGNYDETFVVDWGLARTLGEAPQPRRPLSASEAARETGVDQGEGQGMAFGTPAYMSPEQADGQMSEFRAATDIYNLGAVLYTLLAGCRPLKGPDLLAMLRQARESRFPRPRQINPRVPAALEAICLKAMAKEPSQRFASCQELAADVKRWLADEPVSCYSDSWVNRARRWALRHRSWVVSAVALAVFAVLALSIGAALINEQRKAAEDSYRMARRAVDDSFERVSENRLLQAPGMRPLREELLRESLRYYSQFVTRRSRDGRSNDRQLALTYARIGRINAELGRDSTALNAWAAAAAVYDQLRESKVSDRELDAQDARAHWNLARLHARRADWPLAMTECGRARAALAGHDMSEVRQELTEIDLIEARVLGQSGNHEQARQLLVSSERVLGKILEGDPNDVWYRRKHGQVKEGLADLPGHSIDRHEKLLREARDSLRAVVAESPDDFQARAELARLQERIGEAALGAVDASDVETVGKALRAASDSFSLAVTQRRTLTQQHPEIRDFRRDLADDLVRLAECHDRRAARVPMPEADESSLAIANQCYREALEVYCFLGVDDVRREVERRLATIQYQLGQLHLADGRYDEATRAFDESRGYSARLGERPEEAVEAGLAGAYLLIGYYQWEVGKWREAVPSFESVGAIAGPWQTADERTHGWRQTFAAGCLGLAMALDRLGERERALEQVDRSLDALREVIQGNPADERARIGLACSYFQKAVILDKLGQATAASESWDRSWLELPANPETLYELGREYARYAARIGIGKQAWTAEDQRELKRYRQAAVRCLVAARDSGLNGFERIAVDPALLPLGGYPPFAALLNETPRE